MKQNEAEFLVRRQARVCRGLPLVSYAMQREMFDRLEGLNGHDRVEPDELLDAVIWAAKTSIPALAEYATRLRETRTARDALIIVLRSRRADIGLLGCGYDFNQIILSNPLDGKERKYTCPNCGVEGSYRAPFFVIED